MWRYVLPVGVFAVLVAVFYVGLSRDKRDLSSPLIGKPAPTFELPTIQDPGQTTSSKQFAGRPYILNVWATWCVPCREEHGALLEISRRGEIPIVGLNWRDERGSAQQWLAQLGNPYAATAFDPEGRVAIDWGVYGAPETFLIDAKGNVIYKRIYPMTMDIWKKEVVPLLKEASAGAAGVKGE
jgi:cytochrome c biogenesis protein CcmG/thiol:disulfide interchange protein DsbE